MFMDSLPTASAVASTDLLVIDQGGTVGVPDTATTLVITPGQLLALGYAAWIATLPTSSAGLASGDWYLSNGLPQQVA